MGILPMAFQEILMSCLGTQSLLESRFLLPNLLVRLPTSRMLQTCATITCLQPDLPWVKHSSPSGDHLDMQPVLATFVCL